MNPQEPKSGFFTTPANTPSGNPMAIAVDNPYLSVAEFLTTEVALGLNITTSSPIYASGRLANILLAASSEVNDICRRWFDTQTIDETKTNIQIRPMNPQLVTMVFQNRPYQKVNSLYIQVLKWFIQIDISQSGYLQDFPDKGFIRIVPLLSNSGTGAGSPMPAEIVDKTPLGVLWANYTFGYGTPFTALALAQIGSSKAYQAALYYQLWAPSQGITVYDTAVVVDPANYTVDYPSGTVTFVAGYTVLGAITVAVTSNESVPRNIKEAVILLAGEMIGQAGNNPLGATGYSIQTYSINWGEKTYLRTRIEKLLGPYESNLPMII